MAWGINFENISSYRERFFGPQAAQDPVDAAVGKAEGVEPQVQPHPPPGDPHVVPLYPALERKINSRALAKKLVTIDYGVREILRDYCPVEQAPATETKTYCYVVERHYFSPWWARPFLGYHPPVSAVHVAVPERRSKETESKNERERKMKQVVRLIVGFVALGTVFFALHKLGVIVGKWSRADELTQDVNALLSDDFVNADGDEDREDRIEETAPLKALREIIRQNELLMGAVKDDYARQKPSVLLLLAGATAALAGAIFCLPPLMGAGVFTGLAGCGWMIYTSATRIGTVDSIKQKALALIGLCDENYPDWKLYQPAPASAPPAYE